MTRICTICARGGSKGFRNKNTKMIAGHPLIAHSLRHARESGLFSHIAVSSDHEGILETAARYGADILVQRPDDMASDTAAKIPAVWHCLLEAEKQAGQQFDTHVDLDVTSPLRTVEDIAATPAHPSPYFNMVECDDAGGPHLSKQLPGVIVRRQDAPECYDMNASIYAWKRQALLDMDILFGPGRRLHIMPQDRSIDIDSPLDFRIVEMLMSDSQLGE